MYRSFNSIWRASTTVLLCYFGIWMTSVYGVFIEDYDSLQNDRFTSGFPTNPIANPSFFAADLDFSGVGWDTNNRNKGITLISPQHFVAANHSKPTGNLRFANQDGEVKEYTISGFSTTSFGSETSDLVIGKLSTPIPLEDNIVSYPILDPPSFDFFLDQEILVYGRSDPADDSPRVGLNQVDSLTPVDTGDNNTTMTILFDDDMSNESEALLQDGDSGSPSFIEHNGQLTLVGTHFAIGEEITIDDELIPLAFFDSFVPFYTDQIDIILAEDGFVLERIAVVPEPGTSWLLLGQFLILGVYFALRRNNARENSGVKK